MADKLNLPKANAKIALSPGKVEPAMKAADATSTKLYRIPIDRIKEIPDFNVRVESADYLSHVENLSNSIAKNGFDQGKPLTGYVADEDGTNVIYITDGHTRLAAVNALNEAAEDDAKIAVLPVIVRSPAPSLADLTVALHTGNSGRPLTPFELGIVVKRLMAEESANKKDVAGRLSITTRYLDDVLLLANADKKIKQHIANGSVSSTLAIEMLRANAETAAEKIEAAVEKAASTGKKATKKLTGAKMKRVKATVQIAEDGDMKDIVKAAAKAIRDAVPSAAESEDDDAAILASVDGTVTIIVEVPAPEKVVKKPAKKGKAAKPAKKAKAEPEAEDEAEPAPKAKPKRKKAKPADDLGIEGAEPVTDEGEDDEVLKLPPKVSSDEGDEEEIDI